MLPVKLFLLRKSRSGLEPLRSQFGRSLGLEISVSGSDLQVLTTTLPRHLEVWGKEESGDGRREPDARPWIRLKQRHRAVGELLANVLCPASVCSAQFLTLRNCRYVLPFSPVTVGLSPHAQRRTCRSKKQSNVPCVEITHHCDTEIIGYTFEL